MRTMMEPGDVKRDERNEYRTFPQEAGVRGPEEKTSLLAYFIVISAKGQGCSAKGVAHSAKVVE